MSRIEQLAEGVTLYLGDCRSVMASLEKVDAIITDPPYGNANHDGDWNAALNAHRGIENKPIANDDADGMRDVVDAMLTQAVRLLGKKASACCCFCGGGGGAEARLCVACREDGSRRLGVLSFFGLGQEKSRPWAALPQAT